MGLRVLVVEGNTRQGREGYAESYGTTPAEAYARVIRWIAPDAICDIALPADPGAVLPDAGGLEGYDAVVLTGSALHLYHGTPEILRQIDLMRAVYRAGVPAFGSCWGLQVGAAAAGGTVAPNPAGREIGFARKIAPTEQGRGHPLLAGRPAAFDAPAIHLDAVTVAPPRCTVLATNGLTAIQAAEIAHEGGTFWGVQYHPEFELRQVAAIFSRLVDVLVREGFCADADAAHAMIADLATLDEEPGRTDLAWRYGLDRCVLDPVLRTTEIRNFFTHRVRPERSRRGRA